MPSSQETACAYTTAGGGGAHGVSLQSQHNNCNPVIILCQPLSLSHVSTEPTGESLVHRTYRPILVPRLSQPANITTTDLDGTVLDTSKILSTRIHTAQKTQTELMIC